MSGTRNGGNGGNVGRPAARRVMWLDPDSVDACVWDETGDVGDLDEADDLETPPPPQTFQPQAGSQTQHRRPA